MDNSASTLTGRHGRQFKLLKCIGKGGFGEVYLAEMSTASGFTKTVALKLMRADVQQNDDTAQRMRDEAKLLGMMRHKTIVQADDLVLLAGRPAVIMEYVPGVNHSWVINPKRYEGTIPPRVALSVISAVADALDVAFNRPSTVTNEPLMVLHRDIKPANVRITPDGEVKLLDFGIARAEAESVDREACTTEYQLGSLPYMAPELMDGSLASPATDIYSLGVTLYETLARKRFGWAGESDDMHSNQVETRVGELDLSDWGDAEEDTIEMVKLMLAYDPELRPTAKEVVEVCRELSRIAPGQGIEEWAPDVLTGLKPDEGKPDNGELTGQTLWEDVTASGAPPVPQDEMLDEPTMAIPMTGRVAEPTQSQGGGGFSATHIVILVGILVAAAGAFAFMSKGPAETAEPQQTAAEAAQAAVEAVMAAQAEERAVREAEEAAEREAEEAAAAEAAAEAEAEAARLAEEQAAAAAEAAASRPASTGSSASSAPAPTPDPVPEAAPAGPPVEVRFLSVPYGIPILVDGVAVGVAPRTMELTPGPHVVVFQDGENSIRQEITVTSGGKDRWQYRQLERTIR